MRIMVTGSRTWGACPARINHGTHRFDCDGYASAWTAMVKALLEHLPGETLGDVHSVELLHGDAKGADRMAVEIWRMYGLGPITGYPANWADLGKRAGHVRNGILVSFMPDVVVAFHLDNSPGTADAITQARAAGLDVHVYPKETP